MCVSIGCWLLAIGCWPREQAVGRESPLRGLPPLGGRWQCEALTNEGVYHTGSWKLEAGHILYKESIRYVAIGCWLLAIGYWPRAGSLKL